MHFGAIATRANGLVEASLTQRVWKPSSPLGLTSRDSIDLLVEIVILPVVPVTVASPRYSGS